MNISGRNSISSPAAKPWYARMRRPRRVARRARRKRPIHLHARYTSLLSTLVALRQIGHAGPSASPPEPHLLEERPFVREPHLLDGIPQRRVVGRHGNVLLRW